VVAPTRADAAEGHASDDAAPEALRGVPREHRHLPSAGEAREQRARGARAHAAPAVFSQDEELADLADARAREVGTLAHQRETRGPAVEAHDEMVAMVAPPESSVPAGRAERAVGLDAPAVAAEVVDVELDQAPHERHVGPSQRAKAEARHVVSGRGGARRDRTMRRRDRC